MLYQELAIIFNHIEKKCTSNRLILSVQNYKIIATFYIIIRWATHVPLDFFLSLESSVIIPKRKEKKSKSVRARGGVRP